MTLLFLTYNHCLSSLFFRTSFPRRCSFFPDLRPHSCSYWLLQIGGFFIWTYTYQLIRTSSMKFKALQATEEVSKVPNNDFNSDGQTRLLEEEDPEQVAISVSSIKSVDDTENEVVSPPHVPTYILSHVTYVQTHANPPKSSVGLFQST